MTWALLSFLILVAGLLALFAWSLYRAKGDSPANPAAWAGEQPPRRHSLHFSQIRQSMSDEDILFLTSRGSRSLAKQARAERRRAVIYYVEGLHSDFRKLFHLGRTLASLSPEVAERQEAERVWLALRFEYRYQFVRAMLHLRASPVPQLERMTEIVGVLSRRLDAAMAEMGERAVLALETASTAERRRVDLT